MTPICLARCHSVFVCLPFTKQVVHISLNHTPLPTFQMMISICTYGSTHGGFWNVGHAFPSFRNNHNSHMALAQFIVVNRMFITDSFFLWWTEFTHTTHYGFCNVDYIFLAFCYRPQFVVAFEMYVIQCCKYGVRSFKCSFKMLFSML